MMKTTVFVFRDSHFAPAGDTVASAAPSDVVVSVFGGGGVHQTLGLSTVFGGAAVYREENTGAFHLGVWGARKAAKFRSALRRAGFEVETVKSPPPGRLAHYSTK